MNLKEFLHLSVGTPDGSETGCLRCHYIDSVAKIHTQATDTRPDKFQYFVFHEATGKYCGHQCQRNVLWTDTVARCSFYPNRNNGRCSNLIRAAEQLLDQLSPALANAQCSQGTVASVRVGAENHSSAAAKNFSCIGVND